MTNIITTPIPKILLGEQKELNAVYVEDSRKPAGIDKSLGTLLFYTVNHINWDCIPTEKHKDYIEHPLLPEILEDFDLRLEFFPCRYSNMPELGTVYDRFMVMEKEKCKSIGRFFRALLLFSFERSKCIADCEMKKTKVEGFIPAKLLRSMALMSRTPVSRLIPKLELLLEKYSCLNLQVKKYQNAYRLSEINTPDLRKLSHEELWSYKEELEGKYGNDTWEGRYTSNLNWYGSDERSF